MYRNIEGYASPTEGAAYANIIHEERMKRKKERAKQKAACEDSGQLIRMADDTQWKLAWTSKDCPRSQKRRRETK